MGEDREIKIVTKNILLTVLNELLKVCKAHKIKVVLMGGLAVSMYARPRSTYDIDGIISIKKEQIRDFLNILKEAGFRYDKKDPVKFIQGLPFITLCYVKHKTYVDLFIAGNEFQENILTRAKNIRFNKMLLKLISPEDLILIKLQTGRERDLEDVRDMISENKGKIDFSYLKKWSRALNVHIFLEDELKSLRIDGG
jgi:predicted nucleotidyltransferase